MGSSTLAYGEGVLPGGPGTLVDADAVNCAALPAMAQRQKIQSGFLVLKPFE